tara:strand:+ start:2151 stop:2336 length:186 start_codon:yes stop_codon:yes gene_type:complete
MIIALEVDFEANRYHKTINSDEITAIMPMSRITLDDLISKKKAIFKYYDTLITNSAKNNTP